MTKLELDERAGPLVLELLRAIDKWNRGSMAKSAALKKVMEIATGKSRYGGELTRIGGLPRGMLKRDHPGLLVRIDVYCDDVNTFKDLGETSSKPSIILQDNGF
jgi:hypothetical protein